MIKFEHTSHLFLVPFLVDLEQVNLFEWKQLPRGAFQKDCSTGVSLGIWQKFSEQFLLAGRKRIANLLYSTYRCMLMEYCILFKTEHYHISGISMFITIQGRLQRFKEIFIIENHVIF